MFLHSSFLRESRITNWTLEWLCYKNDERSLQIAFCHSWVINSFCSSRLLFIMWLWRIAHCFSFFIWSIFSWLFFRYWRYTSWKDWTGGGSVEAFDEFFEFSSEFITVLWAWGTWKIMSFSWLIPLLSSAEIGLVDSCNSVSTLSFLDFGGLSFEVYIG